MWLVRIALSRPYTFVVLAILIMILGLRAILKTPTDIFPEIKIPVISVVWNYSGLPPTEMADRITSIFERAVTTTVNDIEHIESESLIGVSITKLYFHKNVKIAEAIAEVTANAQTILKFLPQGTTPPLILSYNASTVPIMQLVLSSDSLPEQKLNDLGQNFIRTQLATVQGASLPFPYGGKIRQICVDLHTKAMQSFGISAQNVNAAVNSQSIIIPAGTQKIGNYEYIIKLNNSPDIVKELNYMPVKFSPNRILYVKDVAYVRDGFAPQTNIVKVNGSRAIMMSILKTGSASTLAIIKRVKEILPTIRNNMPSALKLSIFGDQSMFVRAAINGVVFEAIIAAILTGFMVLIFLGSWQSTLIIIISIPLSILASIVFLSFLGETLNMMTLGGLALAVGILVDDATVTIENINWNLAQGKNIKDAILDGAHQIAIPAFVSTLCICIVFIPMFYLGGVPQYLFIPMAEAVIFAMLTSYFLSRTLVPTLAQYFLDKQSNTQHESNENPNRLVHYQKEFEQYFLRFRNRYQSTLKWCLHNANEFIPFFLSIVVLLLIILSPWIGSNLFPKVDAKQILLHIRGPTGTRVEETASLTEKVNETIRNEIRPEELKYTIDNIGLPVSGINLSYSNSATTGPQDADLLIALKDKHRSIEDITRSLRWKLIETFPGIQFSFLPADIVNQILNFGQPSPITIQISGLKSKENYHYARRLQNSLRHISGIVDVQTRQANNYPILFVNADRSRAIELGFTERDIGANLLLTLTGSFQLFPNFWVNPKTGVSYNIVTQAPQYEMDSLQTLLNTPLANLTMNTPLQILGAVANIERKWAPSVISHYNVQPVIDIFANVQDRDLGSVSKDIDRLLKKTKQYIPKGTQVFVKGQIETLHGAFHGLYLGILFSILLVYLLIVVNLQSWLDPFIIITALPAALAGIASMLFITHTPLSVPALTGTITCMGVATANSILIINFARHHLREGNSPFDAALEAGVTRIRPVLMTALAMIIGVLPMALGLGESGEQNAPLGRAIIGGLSFATIATLLFVPTVFYAIHHKRMKAHA